MRGVDTLFCVSDFKHSLLIGEIMIFELRKQEEAQPNIQTAQPTRKLWTEISTEQQESTSGGYPWSSAPQGRGFWWGRGGTY